MAIRRRSCVSPSTNVYFLLSLANLEPPTCHRRGRGPPQISRNSLIPLDPLNNHFAVLFFFVEINFSNQWPFVFFYRKFLFASYLSLIVPIMSHDHHRDMSPRSWVVANFSTHSQECSQFNRRGRWSLNSPTTIRYKQTHGIHCIVIIINIVIVGLLSPEVGWMTVDMCIRRRLNDDIIWRNVLQAWAEDAVKHGQIASTVPTRLMGPQGWQEEQQVTSKYATSYAFPWSIDLIREIILLPLFNLRD